MMLKPYYAHISMVHVQVVKSNKIRSASPLLFSTSRFSTSSARDNGRLALITGSNHLHDLHTLFDYLHGNNIAKFHYCVNISFVVIVVAISTKINHGA